MADVAVLETEQTAPVLPPEKVKDAANLIRNSVRDIFSSWEELKNPRLRDQGGVTEFRRPQGAIGEGLWDVEDSGGYSTYHLLTSGAEWMITVQPGGIGSYKDSFISARRKTTQNGKEIIESPDRNSQEALDLAVRFVQQINGGEIPSTLLQISSSQNLQAPSHSK